jgi:parvulin-like peptidyl-prolyl isomerase
LITPSTKRTGEDVIYGWIDRKLVDHEALSRHYEMKPDLKKMVYRYENQLLKNTFIKKVIYPQINITEEALKKYYLDKQKDFLKPRRYRIQQITVTTIDDAREILNALGDGADFSWLAKKRSSDSAASRGGEVGWLTKKELPEQIREIIDNLKIGDISPIIEIASYYRIIKLIDKTEEEAEDFVRVKDAVYKAYFNEQLNSILEKDINELKKDSEIIIYGEEIKYLEEKFQK